MRYRGGGKIGAFDDDKPTLYEANGCWKLGEACQWLSVDRWPRRTITITNMPAYVDTTIGNFGEIKPNISSKYPYGGVIRWQYSDNGGTTWNEKPNNANHTVNTNFGGQYDTTWGNLTLSNQWRNLSGIPQITATATATLSGGSVSGVTITNAGSGYPPNSTVSVLFQPLLPGIAGTRATGYATTNSSGQVSAVVRTNNGSGYGNNVPSVRISPSNVPITDINGGLPVDGRLWRVIVTAGLRSASSDYFDEGSQTWQGRSEEWNDTIVVTINQQPESPSGDVIVGQEFSVSANASAVGSEHGLSYPVKYRWQVSDIDPALTNEVWWTTLTGANSDGSSIDFRPPAAGDTWIRCIAYVSYSDTDNNRIVVGRPEAAAYSNAIYVDVLPAG
jgi:hypothetical protein